MNDYDTDGFKTLVLRCERGVCGAVPENLLVLHYGDSLNVVVTGVRGCVPADLVFNVVSEDGSQLAEVGAGGWEFVPGRTDAVYAAVTLATGNAETLAQTLALGASADVQVYLFETGGRTWVDVSMPFFPNPAVAGGSAGAQALYVTRASIAALARTFLASPASSAYEREQRIIAFMNSLSALSP